jgi:uncharacterized membrane protein
MDWPLFVVQWLHVLLGVLWFGYTLSMYFLITPALNALPESQLRETYFRLGEIGGRVFPIVGILVLLLGILRGTVFGPIKTFDALLGTGYGITWLVALVVTIGIFVNGARFIAPTFAAIRESSDLSGSLARLRRVAQVDLALFVIVFTCMVLMRFGATFG